MKRNGKRPPKTTAMTTAKPVVAKIVQPHGGALNAGGTPGNIGGPGQPSGVIRKLCRGAFAERVPVLTSIADGEPVQHIDVPLLLILRHAACPKCGDKLKPKDVAAAALVTVSGKVSASPKERTRAVDVLGKYGLDARTQLAVDEVKECLRNTIAVIRQELSPNVATRIINRIRGHWAA